MPTNTYQTYTAETPIHVFREDFLRRDAMCAAAAKKTPTFQPIADEAAATVAAIDQQRAAQQATEDALTRARALEDLAKIEAVDIYAQLRLTWSAQDKKLALTMLADPPSLMARYEPKEFTEKVALAFDGLGRLPEGDPVRAAFLGLATAEFEEFRAADLAEDEARRALAGAKLSMTVYKADLARRRNAQLGAIQQITGDRAKTAMFTVPWRKASRSEATAETTDAGTTAPSTTV